MTTTRDPVRLLIVGAPPLMSAGLEALLRPHCERVELVLDPRQESVPDVVLVDLGHEGSVALMVYAAARHGLPVVALLPEGDSSAAVEAVRSGAVVSVWYSVGVEDLVSTVSRAATGARFENVAAAGASELHALRAAGLSERESQVLDLIAGGLSNEDISRRLYVTKNTVKTYVRTTYRKIGVTSRSQAVAWRIQRGYAARVASSDLNVG